MQSYNVLFLKNNSFVVRLNNFIYDNEKLFMFIFSLTRRFISVTSVTSYGLQNT